MERLVGLALISASFFVLLWMYEAFPEQRGILVFGSIVGAMIVTRGTGHAKGDES